MAVYYCSFVNSPLKKEPIDQKNSPNFYRIREAGAGAAKKYTYHYFNSPLIFSVIVVRSCYYPVKNVTRILMEIDGSLVEIYPKFHDSMPMSFIQVSFVFHAGT